MDPEVRKELADGLHRASELLGDGPFDSTKRREILRACEAVRAALLGMGFDEGASRKRVVSFLRSVALANGVIGKRTSGRLSHRTFEEDADAALKWLLEKFYLEDGGSEGFMLTDEGYGYLDQHKSELATSPPERKGGRGRGGSSPRSGKAEAKPEPKPEAKTEPKADKAEAKVEVEAMAEAEAEPSLVMLPPAGEPEVSAT
jgi:hypothetical protein